MSVATITRDIYDSPIGSLSTSGQLVTEIDGQFVDGFPRESSFQEYLCLFPFPPSMEQGIVSTKESFPISLLSTTSSLGDPNIGLSPLCRLSKPTTLGAMDSGGPPREMPLASEAGDLHDGSPRNVRAGRCVRSRWRSAQCVPCRDSPR